MAMQGFRLGTMVTAAVLLAACGGDSNDAPPDPMAEYRDQALTWTACDPSIFGREETEWFEDLGDRLQCADVRVPIDYDDPAGGGMVVAMTRVAASDAERRIGAMLINPGGPGGDGLSMAPTLASLFALADPDLPNGDMRHDMQARFDLIGFSPRGTGASTTLSCESNEWERPHPFPLEDRSPATMDAILYNAWLIARTCQKNPLTPHINTEQTVEDMELIRHLLDQEQLHYLGYSYGTWLGAWYAARHPERVGRFLLDSSMDFTTDFAENRENQFGGSQRVFDQVLAVRAAGYPDFFGLGTDANAIRQQFLEFPEVLQGIVGPGIGLQNRKRFNGSVVAYTAAIRLAETLREQPQAGLPEVIDDLNARQFSPWPPADEAIRQEAIGLANTYYGKLNPTPQSIRLGGDDATYWAVICNDTAVNTDPQYWIDLGDRFAVDYPLSGGEVTFQPCSYWGGPVVSKPEPALTAEAGTLMMLQAQLDPATVAEGALRTFNALPNAHLVMVENEITHGLFPYDTACVDEPVMRYFLEGEVPPRRSDCPALPFTDPYEEYAEDDGQAGQAAQRGTAAERASPYRDPERARALREHLQDMIQGPVAGVPR